MVVIFILEIISEVKHFLPSYWTKVTLPRVNDLLYTFLHVSCTVVRDLCTVTPLSVDDKVKRKGNFW